MQLAEKDEYHKLACILARMTFVSFTGIQFFKYKNNGFPPLAFSIWVADLLIVFLYHLLNLSILLYIMPVNSDITTQTQVTILTSPSDCHY